MLNANINQILPKRIGIIKLTKFLSLALIYYLHNPFVVESMFDNFLLL